MTDATEMANAILEMTQEMIALAEQGDISAFREIQARRDGLVSELQTAPLELETPEGVRETLIEAKKLNDQLRRALSAQEQALLDRKSEIKRGQRMRQAYGKNS